MIGRIAPHTIFIADTEIDVSHVDILTRNDVKVLADRFGLLKKVQLQAKELAFLEIQMREMAGNAESAHDALVKMIEEGE